MRSLFGVPAGANSFHLFFNSHRQKVVVFVVVVAVVVVAFYSDGSSEVFLSRSASHLQLVAPREGIHTFTARVV